ncbi:MAG: hypothetical protein HZA90_15900 [Verrucomicrobia bacterium]|nr:hypothetical protein [Verrucomicrobiota bacterium]
MNEPNDDLTQEAKAGACCGGRKWLVRGLVAAGAVVVLAALVWLEESWRGKQAWESQKRAAEAKGDKLDWRVLIPKAVPDDQNFAATPLLRPLFANEALTPPASKQELVARFRRLANFDLTLGVSKTRGFPHFANVERNEETELKGWQKFYRGNKQFTNVTASSSKSPADDVLRALGRFDEDLAELEAAAARPQNRAPIEYQEDQPSRLFLPRVARLKEVSLVPHLRAVARLEAGQAPAALSDVKLCFRLADTLRQEPTLLTHLTRLQPLYVALQTVREGLARHAWDDAQLVELEKTLAPLDLLRDYQQAMRGERVLNVASLECLRTGHWPRLGTNLSVLGDMETQAGLAKYRLMPTAMSYHNQATVCRWHEEFALPAVEEKEHRVFPQKVLDWGQEVSQATDTIYRGFACLAFPALTNAVSRTARAQTVVDHLRIACALERHRLAHGQLPDKLDALAPKFLEKLPHDLATGEPMKYRRAEGGAYTLYSVGWNLKDDGGDPMLIGNPPRPDVLRGDWVWKLEK